MSVLWTYFWPLFAAGLVIGVVAGRIAFAKRSKRALVAGAGLCLVAAGLWHGPMGAAGRLTASVDRMTRQALEYYEMTQVAARLDRAPLNRQLILEGPADDFQRSELARVLSEIPGVSRARWSPQFALPLIVEAMIAAILGFLAGLLLAYLVELHRRHNAQWNW